MKKTTVILLLVTFLAACTRTEYIPVTGKYAYLVDNAVFMVKDGKWGLYDQTYEQVAVPPVYDTIYFTKDHPIGFVAILNGKKTFFTSRTYDMHSIPFDSFGKNTEPQALSDHYKFRNGSDSVYCLIDGYYDNPMYVSYDGEELYGPYEDYFFLTRERLAFKKNGLWGIYDREKKKEVLSPAYRSLFAVNLIRTENSYLRVDENLLLLVQTTDGEWETLDWKGRSGVPDVLHIDPRWMSKPVIDYSQSGHPDLRRFGSCNLRIRTGRDDIVYAEVQKNVGQQKSIYLDY